MRKLPKLTTDEEVEALLDEDLSDLDFTQFKPATFELVRNDARVNMRLPGRLLATVKARARARGIPYQRLIRETLEKALGETGGTSS